MSDGKIMRIGTGDDSYTIHGVRGFVIHELRKVRDWKNPEMYADRKLHPGEQGRIDDRVYCMVSESEIVDLEIQIEAG